MKNNDAVSRIKDDDSHGEQGFYVVNENGDLRIELDKKYNLQIEITNKIYKIFWRLFLCSGVIKDEFKKVNDVNPGTKNF